MMFSKDDLKTQSHFDINDLTFLISLLKNTSIKNQMTIMNIINACATELAKNATTDPMLALSAFPKSKSCTNSTMSTAIKVQ